MSCDRHYGIAGYPDCSGHGRCVDGFCVCESGWSSIGDFELVEGYDCDIYHPAVRILSISILIIIVPVFIYELYVIYSMMNKKQINRRKVVTTLICTLSTILSFPPLILKIVDSIEYSVGKSYGLAFNQSCFVSFSFSLGTTYTLIVVKFFEGYSKMIGPGDKNSFHNNISIWKTILTISPYVLFVSVMITQYVGIHYGPRYSDSVNASMGYIVIAAYCVNLTCVEVVNRKFMAEISKFLEQNDNSSALNINLKRNQLNADIQRVLDVSRRIYKTLFRFLSGGLIVFVFTTLWKFMRRKLTYIILIHALLLNLRTPYYLENIRMLSKESANPKLVKVSSISIQGPMIPGWFSTFGNFFTNEHSKIQPTTTKIIQSVEVLENHGV